MRWDRVVAGMGEAAKYLYVTLLVCKRLAAGEARELSPPS